MRRTSVVVLLLASASAVGAAEPVGLDAADWLAGALQDAETGDVVLAALRATGDKELTPLFIAVSRSGEKRRRLFAATMLREFCGAEAAPVLAERLAKDTSMAVRTEALLHLQHLGAATPEHLTAALVVDDEKVQCLAARGLVQCGRAEQATATLRRLAGSKDAVTSTTARVALLGAGDQAQEPILREAFRSPKTTDAVISFAMEQIATEKVTAAVELVGQVAWSERREAVRMRAFKTLSAISPQAAAAIVGALRSSDKTLFRVYLLETLSNRDDSGPHLTKLAAGTDGVAALARFELARPPGGVAATEAARGVLKVGHPVMLDYVLDRARKDIDARGAAADFYTPVLAEMIRLAEPKPRQMDASHYRAAQGATLLADLGTPAAVGTLTELLTGRYDAVKRSVGAGLIRAKNRAACEPARTLLTSPYEELASDAALTLGRFGDPAAATPLRRVLAGQKRHRTEMVALAAWYLLKIDGRAAEAVKTLASKVR